MAEGETKVKRGRVKGQKVSAEKKETGTGIPNIVRNNTPRGK